MKILFVNPPVVRYENQKFDTTVQKKVSHPLFLLQNRLRKIKTLSVISRTLNTRKLMAKSGITKNIRYGVRAGSRWPFTVGGSSGECAPFPFMMAYATSLLKNNGFEVGLIDAVVENEHSYNGFIERVKKENANIVVIECSAPTIDIDLWVAERISHFSEVALAGSYLTAKNALEIKHNSLFIKYLLKAEYIISSLEMARTQKAGIYEPIIADLDSIPLPFRDYAGAIKYYDKSMPTPRPQLQIYGSKGCPFQCSFCLWPQMMYQGKFFARQPQKIAEEIKMCVAKYGYKSIFFDDDTFNIGNERINKLCDELKNIGLPWTMMGRLDCSPNSIFDKMVESGCVGMRFGLETFNTEVLKKINKGLERIDFAATLKYLSDKYPQLMIHLTMMKDLPGQTDEIHQQDMAILRDLGYSTDNIYRNYQLSTCVPFPGTKLYDQIVQEKGEKFLEKNNNLFDGSQTTVMSTINNDEKK